MAVAGSVGLKEFLTLRVQLKDEKNQKLTADEARRITNMPKREFSLEAELDHLQRQLDIDDWEQKKAWRPGLDVKNLPRADE